MKKLLSMMAVLMLVNAFGCGDKTTTVTDDDVEHIDDSTVGEEEVTEEMSPELEKDINTLETIITDETATSSDCATIVDEELKKTCEQSFIYNSAVANKDKSICGQLENTADQEMCVGEIE